MDCYGQTDFWQQSQHTVLSVDVGCENCDDAWPDPIARPLCGQVIPGVSKQQWTMTMLTLSYSEIAASWLQGIQLSQPSCCLGL